MSSGREITIRPERRGLAGGGGGGSGSLQERNELEGPVNSFTAASLQSPKSSAERRGVGGIENQTMKKKIS